MTLACTEQGAGPALVLLHAFPLSRDLWREVAPTLAAAGWRIITPDLPGFGESREVIAPTVDAMADEVAALMDELGVQTAVVGGCSLGGYVALAFAHRYPQRVAGLVLADTKASADDDVARANRERVVQQVEHSGSTHALAVAMPDTLLGESTRASQPALVAWVQHQIDANTAAGVAAAQRAMATRSAHFDTLSQLRVPVLCIRGSEDLPASAADQVAMAVAATDVVAVEVEGAGHLLPIEQPAAFVEHVGAFLARVRGPHC